MKYVKNIFVVACAVLIATVYLVPAPSAEAASSSALSINPKKNYVIEPGDSVEDQLRIRNLDSNIPLELQMRVIDFSYTDDTGTPKLFLDPNEPQKTWSLKPFMNVPKRVTVGPGDSKTVDIDVAIPKGQGAGSYYSAIVYSSGGGSDGGNVGLSASGVTLVFVTVPGKVHEDLQLKKLGAYNVARAGEPAHYSFITTDMPQRIGYTLENNGNVAESPVGSITLKHMFGGETVITDINPAESLALIGQTRTFTACIKLKTQQIEFAGTNSNSNECVSPSLWPGRYTVTLDAYYGQNGNPTRQVVGNASFWYLPWWFILVSIVVLLVLAYFIWRFVRFIRYQLYGHRPRRPRARSRRRR